MTAKPIRLLARKAIDERIREAALGVLLGWAGRTRHPLPVVKGRKA